MDLVINQFDEIPQSFHQKVLWRDDFVCLISSNNPIRHDFSLETYLQAHHIWVSKTGMGIGVGMNPSDIQRRGCVDNALNSMGKVRNIRVYTRHYQSAVQLAAKQDLIVTLPRKATYISMMHQSITLLDPPFPIPHMTVTMSWSPLLQNNTAHRWIRALINEIAQGIDAD